MHVIEDKRSAHFQYIDLPNSKNLLALKYNKESSVNNQKICERTLGWTKSKYSTFWKYLEQWWDVKGINEEPVQSKTSFMNLDRCDTYRENKQYR